MSDQRCNSCLPALQVDVAYQQAKLKAIEQAKEKMEPVAVYRTEEGYEVCNAFTAYKLGYPVIEVVPTYNGDPAKEFH